MVKNKTNTSGVRGNKFTHTFSELGRYKPWDTKFSRGSHELFSQGKALQSSDFTTHACSAHSSGHAHRTVPHPMCCFWSGLCLPLSSLTPSPRPVRKERVVLRSRSPTYLVQGNSQVPADIVFFPNSASNWLCGLRQPAKLSALESNLTCQSPKHVAHTWRTSVLLLAGCLASFCACWRLRLLPCALGCILVGACFTDVEWDNWASGSLGSRRAAEPVKQGW